MKRTLLLGAIGIAAVAGAAGARLVAYSFDGPNWATRQVPFYVNPTNGDVSQDAAIAALQAAAAVWTTQSDADVQLYYAGRTSGGTISNNGRNEVFFRNETNGSWAGATYYWYDGSGHITDADMVIYDGAYRFFTGQSGCSGSGIYIEDLAAHEFGHFLGLNHSSRTVATMYPTMEAYCDQGWRTLDNDDRAAIEALYPTAGNSATPPSAPTNLSAQNGNGAVSLSWTDRASDEDGFTLERSTDGASFSTLAQIGANVTWFSDQSVAADHSYSYRLRAWNDVGTSSYSNVASVTMPSEAPASSPSAATLFSPVNGATGVSTNATLTWSTATGAASYDVYFGTSSNPPLFRSGLLSTSVSANKLSGSTTYYWRVVARNSNGDSASPTWSFTTASGKGGGKGGGSKGGTKGGGRRR
jgi:Matrixin